MASLYLIVCPRNNGDNDDENKYNNNGNNNDVSEDAFVERQLFQLVDNNCTQQVNS